MGEEGRLTIETANYLLDESYARQHGDVPPGQYVLIAVTDTGAGMSPDVIARAFDPFFTTKDVGKGTGLGLSMVYGFVKQSGGHVKIYSEPGQGTSIKIYLPRFYGAEDAPDEHADRASARPDGQGELVLVVEDEESVRTLTADSLRELGYEVVEANSAAAALRALDANPRIALLFTDIVMPDMNGRKLADEARQAPPRSARHLHHRLHPQRRGPQRRARSGRQLPAQALHAPTAERKSARGAGARAVKRHSLSPSWSCLARPSSEFAEPSHELTAHLLHVSAASQPGSCGVHAASNDHPGSRGPWCIPYGCKRSYCSCALPLAEAADLGFVAADVHAAPAALAGARVVEEHPVARRIAADADARAALLVGQQRGGGERDFPRRDLQRVRALPAPRHRAAGLRLQPALRMRCRKHGVQRAQRILRRRLALGEGAEDRVERAPQIHRGGPDLLRLGRMIGRCPQQGALGAFGDEADPRRPAQQVRVVRQVVHLGRRRALLQRVQEVERGMAGDQRDIVDLHA